MRFLFVEKSCGCGAQENKVEYLFAFSVCLGGMVWVCLVIEWRSRIAGRLFVIGVGCGRLVHMVMKMVLRRATDDRHMV
jgi:hypothetical protein